MNGIAESSVTPSTVRKRLDLNSAFTTLLVLFPFFCVCLLLRMFLLSALFPVVGFALLVLARPAQRRRPDFAFVAFAAAGSLLVLFLILPILNLLLTTDPSR